MWSDRGIPEWPVLVNDSTGTLFPSVFLPGVNLFVSTENFVTRYVNLTISVRTTFSLEMRKDFRSSYATLIYLLAAGFVDGFSPNVFDYARSKKKTIRIVTYKDSQATISFVQTDVILTCVFAFAGCNTKSKIEFGCYSLTFIYLVMIEWYN
jgi:hypothetical protein